MRSQIYRIEERLINLQGMHLDVSKISWLIKSFSNKMNLRHNAKKDVFKMFEAKTNLEACITSIRGIIGVEDNPLIIEFKSIYQIDQKNIDNYFENYLSGLDQLEKQIKDSFRNSSLLNEIYADSLIKSLSEELKSGMETFIIMPLFNASKIYSMHNIDNRKLRLMTGEEVSNREAFQFILFKQILNSGMIKGSDKRQLSKQNTTGAGGTTIHETTNIRQARQIPRPIVTEENKEEPQDFDIITYEDF
jgi:hypothetical protein